MDDNLRVASILVQRNADVNAVDDDMWTPLHTACACECIEIVQLLLDNEVDVTCLDVDNNLAMDLCPKDSDTYLIIEQFMFDSGYDSASILGMKQSEALLMLAEVKDFVQESGFVNTTNEEQVTLLHIAAANNYSDVVKFLVKNGASIKVKDDDGCTPLHLASKFGHTSMVKFLLSLNANPEERNLSGFTPADVAATDLIEEMVKTALLTFDASRRTSVLIGEIFAGEPEDVPADTLYRKIGRVLMAKTEAHYESETRLPPDGSEEISSVIDPCREGLQVLHSISQDDTYVPTPTASDNLSSLPELTENTLLQELMLRYSKDLVYTYVGDILIAVNPFKVLPIYSKKASEMYTNLTNRDSVSPHVFAVADRAYQAHIWEKKPQCCIISGESGAGKTETSKYFVQHLLSRAGSSESEMNEKIQQVNPLLEVFGNAQTIMNDNSSRFGKFIEVLLSENGVVAGARISEYLLEKSRVTQQTEGERNFHIFYLLFNGMNQAEKDHLGLKRPQDHRYLKRGDLSSLNGLEICGKKFKAVKNCLKYIGFSKEDEEYLFHILAAVILLGDFKFLADPAVDGAVTVKEQNTLSKVAELLQVNSEDLLLSIVSEVIITRGEEFKKYRTKLQAEDCRDALAKALYSRLFSWVVNNINQLLQPINEDTTLNEIGVLDIFGFENFNKNSFEQICINLANEKIQGFFNEHIFLQEKEDCEREGLDMSWFKFTSNQPIIDVFQANHKGILDLLIEESHFPRGTDQSLANKLHQGPGLWGKSIYFKPRDEGTSFSIVHYAGIVTYSLDGVVEKNRDTLAKSLIFTMKCSKNKVIREMFTTKLTRKGSIAPSFRQTEQRKSSVDAKVKDIVRFHRERNKCDRISLKKGRSVKERLNKRGQATVANHFKNSLNDMMEKMKRSNPHFIRCIKPNTAKLPDRFTPEYVIAQLRYTGIMDTTRIRRDGYPLRLTTDEFMQRFGVITLLPPTNVRASSPQKCREALNYHNIQGFVIGKTKMFFKHYHTERLQQITYQLLKKVVRCQKVIRGFLTRRSTKSLLLKVEEDTNTVQDFLSDMEFKMVVVVEAQKEKSDSDEAQHMEETLRGVAEAEESKQTTEMLAEMEDQELYVDVEIQDTLDELSIKASTISSLSDSFNDLELPDSASENTVEVPTDDVTTENLVREDNPALVAAAVAAPPTDTEHVFMVDEPDQVIEVNEERPAVAPGYMLDDEEDLPPPPEDLDPVIYCNEMMEDLPSPPPMSEVSEESRQNIAKTRAAFLMKEQQAIEEAKHPPKVERGRSKPFSFPPSVPTDNWSNRDRPENGSRSPQRLPTNGQLGENERTVYVNNNVQINNAQNRFVNKRPPALPKRSPSTRITSGMQQPLEYDDIVVDELIPPPPSYPAPVPPAHDIPTLYRLGKDRVVPPPPSALPPPPPPSNSVYDDVLDLPPPSQDSTYDYLEPHPPPDDPPPPPPPPNHPLSLGYNSKTAPPLPPVPPPPAPPPPSTSMAHQLEAVKLRPAKQQNRGPPRNEAPPASDNQMEMMLREIRRKQNERKLSEISMQESAENSEVSGATKSPPPLTSPKPIVKGHTSRLPSSPPPPPAVLPKPSKGTQENRSSPPATRSKPPAPNVPKMEPIDDSVPQWKKAMLEKKQREEMAKQQEEERKKQEEDDKWKGIPEWRKKLMLAKEQKKAEEDAQYHEANKEKLDMEAKLAEMPEWKRKVYMKKHGIDTAGEKTQE